MKRALTSYLETHTLVAGDAQLFAGLLDIGKRGFRKLRARARSPEPVRAAHAPRGEISAEFEHMARTLWRPLVPGHDGSRSLIDELVRAGVALVRGAVRWVQRLVATLKRERAAGVQERIEHERVHTQVLVRDTLWSCDESYLAREKRGEVRAFAVRETHVPRTLWLSIGRPAHSRDLVWALERTAQRRGGWPLVLMLDNGGANRGCELLRVLEEQRVIALFNVPHTPQHNAFVERAFGELKVAARLTKRDLQRCEARPTRSEVAQRLRDACAQLDRTPRWALGAATPAEIDRSTPRADHLVSRERFYRDTCDALARVAQQRLSPRARRRAEREAIWSTLQLHGLVVRTKGGGQPRRCSKRNVSA